MRFTKKRILGIIGVVWGGGVAISGVFRALSENAAYAAGQTTGFALGAAMFAVGLYFAVRADVRERLPYAASSNSRKSKK